MSKKIKTLVTGGAGFIGSHLVDKLIELNHDVVVVDNLSTGNIENIEGKKVEFNKLDISEKYAKKALSRLLKDVDYVFHLAAIPRIMYCIENPNECHKANVEGTINLLEACRENKIKKIILSSTCCVYGDPNELPVSEEEPIKLNTPYASQKYMQELYVDLYTKMYKLPSVMLRYFTVYGTKRQSEKGSFPNVLAAFSKQKRETNTICITGDGKQTRDFVHVYDVVDANIIAMESDFEKGEVFNIGYGKPTSLNEIASHFDCEIEYIPDRPNETKFLYSTINKAIKELKWYPKIPFVEGIKKYINL